jgi:hypothetical protein
MPVGYMSKVLPLLNERHYYSRSAFWKGTNVGKGKGKMKEREREEKRGKEREGERGRGKERERESLCTR